MAELRHSPGRGLFTGRTLRWGFAVLYFGLLWGAFANPDSFSMPALLIMTPIAAGLAANLKFHRSKTRATKRRYPLQSVATAAWLAVSAFAAYAAFTDQLELGIRLCSLTLAIIGLYAILVVGKYRAAARIVGSAMVLGGLTSFLSEINVLPLIVAVAVFGMLDLFKDGYDAADDAAESVEQLDSYFSKRLERISKNGLPVQLVNEILLRQAQDQTRRRRACTPKRRHGRAGISDAGTGRSGPRL